MADKSAYVPVDAASGATGNKTDLDIDLDGDFFGSSNNNKPALAPPLKASPALEPVQKSPEPKESSVVKSPSIVHTAGAKSPSTTTPSTTGGEKPKVQYQKSKSYKKTVAYKAK